ncbi:MAG: hypothetical protein KDI72_02410 [Xanthomonadales bacterium]|nr:hypothetical protein [Xanthomonadales bacterium]
MKRLALLFLFWSVLVPSAHAALFCVSNSTELAQALLSASVTDASDEIRLRTGNYPAPPGGFVYQNFDHPEALVTISGGWSFFFGNPCGVRSDLSAFSTKLSGNNQDRVMRIRPFSSTNVIVEGLTFQQGNTLGLGLDQGQGAGLRVETFVGWTGDVQIRGNAFLNNTAFDYGGGLAASAGGRLVVNNNLFLTNSACRHGAASLTYSGNDTGYLINNTVAYNFIRSGCQIGTSAGGLRIGGISPVLIVNNVLWGNEEFDLVNDSGGLMIRNDFQHLLGPATGGPNYNLSPQFTGNGFFPFRLSADSPLIDLGLVPSSGLPWQLLSYDLDGDPRVIGSSVDLGAFELSDLIFEDGFDG